MIFDDSYPKEISPKRLAKIQQKLPKYKIGDIVVVLRQPNDGKGEMDFYELCEHKIIAAKATIYPDEYRKGEFYWIYWLDNAVLDDFDSGIFYDEDEILYKL